MGKSPACRSLDAAFPSHFVMIAEGKSVDAFKFCSSITTFQSSPRDSLIVGMLYGCTDRNDWGFFDMIPIWNSSIACNDEERIVCLLWAFSCRLGRRDFRTTITKLPGGQCADKRRKLHPACPFSPFESFFVAKVSIGERGR